VGTSRVRTPICRGKKKKLKGECNSGWLAGWWVGGRTQYRTSLHLSTTCGVLQVGYRGMVGDLWYGVATHGMTEERRPGFEPQSAGEKKKAQGGVQGGEKKGSRGSATVAGGSNPAPTGIRYTHLRTTGKVASSKAPERWLGPLVAHGRASQVRTPI
jgi:hypothetical protein